ncbi:ubiquinone anaerobic biosynthesis accessory factor UbiT [Endozoicomonas ascidiicola]|uniref:ubiquinone anaerobic biosynthesis accessory factor UbiT n=1 Tax=Endozoicomonas ascidiicola TaxID=1698521 RepID=UPI000AD7D6B2|nr:SCP2 sterol-binding domain-containing protein [Endozoicomonas ascidiicola]
MSLFSSFKAPLPALPFPAFKKPGMELLGLPIRLLPSALVNKPLTRAINQAFKAPIEEGDFDFLENRCLKIHVTDLAISFYISFDGQQLQASGPRHFDVEFRGNTQAFMKLASRREDPDTLFFQRHLMIEGDTELGLGVKNLLDSIEMEQLPTAIQLLMKTGKKLA